MKIERVERFKNEENMSKIIYINFIELEGEERIGHGIEEIRELIKDRGNVSFFLTDRGDRVIGYMIGKREEMKDGRLVYYLSYIYIMERYRNMGIGGRMIEYLIEYIGGMNIKYIITTSKKGSIGERLYKRKGFIRDRMMEVKNEKFEVLVRYID